MTKRLQHRRESQRADRWCWQETLGCGVCGPRENWVTDTLGWISPQKVVVNCGVLPCFIFISFFFFLAEPCGLQDLSSLTKDWTQAMIKLRTLTARQPGDSVLCPTYLVFVTNFYISCLLPYLFREIPQNYLRGCFPGLSPQFCPPNKT